jgi:hypothetical protein
MQQEKRIDQKKLFIIGGIVIFIILLFITIKVVDGRINDAKISLLIAPKSASVKIDDSSYPTSGDFKIPSGKHTITISKEGFSTITETINLTTGQTYNYFNYLVYPNGSMEWYSSHEDDSYLLEAIIPEIEMKNSNAIIAKYPLLAYLPINIDEYSSTFSEHTKYSISYKINIDNTPTIIITDYTGGKKEEAYKKIQSLGCNPDDYFILYEDKSEPDGWGKASDD